MSALLGADTRRVDLIAEGFRGHSQDIQDLRTMAQRAVAEMRNGWAGPDAEGIVRRWEQEAGPRLTDVATALSTMAAALRAQAEGQRQASGSTDGSRFPEESNGPPGRVGPGGRGGGVSRGGHDTRIDDLDPDDLDGKQPALVDRVKDNVKLNFAQVGEKVVDAALGSLDGGNDNFHYELSAGKVEASAGLSADLDAHGDLIASAGVSAAAYAGQAAGKAHHGNGFANGTVAGKAYVGAVAKADASGSAGPGGARGHLGAEAFAGAKAEADVGGTLAGASAAAGAEVSYGIGAHADVDAELTATEVGISLEVGAALGVGAGVKFDVSVNPQQAISNVGHVVDHLGRAADGVGRGLTLGRDQVARFLDW